MSAYGAELFPSYNDVAARREWEIGLIKEKLEKSEAVDLPLCRIERVSAGEGAPLVRFGLKRGKLLYVFKYPTHDVERDKHRNVITRARFIKDQLERAGYRLVPWDFKKGKPPKFWEERTMEEEDDDLYGPSETTAPVEQKADVAANDDDGESGDEPMDEGLESGEEDEDDSDSELEIIIDKPPTAAKPLQQQQPQESKAIKIEAPPQPTSTHTQGPKTVAPQLPTQPGTAYPAVRTSTVDVNADPSYPPLGKPMSQVDIDADMAEASKPWRLPGADQSDYFNYGFDEFTWEMYRQRQTTMTSNLEQQKAETAQLQSFFGANAGGGAPNVPSGPAAATGGGGGAGNMPMPPGGMPDEMMQMFQGMMSQGIDVGNMDFNTFMGMAQQGGMGGFGGPGAQPGGGGFGGTGGGGGGGGNQGGGGGGGGGGGRRGGRGRGW